MTPEQLKASILQYAMEGKLVKQNPNDESVSELLKRIKAEKQQLIKEKKIKRNKSLPLIEDNEKSFDIPDSWKWVRLDDIFYLKAGKNKKAKDISDSKDENNKYLCYGGNGIRGYVADYNQEGKHPLIGRQGALCGNVHIAQGKFYATEHAIVVHLFGNVDYKWSAIFLKAINLNQYATSTAQPGLSVTRINRVLIPLPPLEEQKRIVSKIEKLMPLVDEYAESYNRLQKIDNEFEDKLKQSVLQYAMEGKLVKQDPNDEPASELLKKIENEKDQLIEEGKIKKSRKLPAITDEEKPFDIPDSWEWVRLGIISEVRGGKRVPRGMKLSETSSYCPYIRVTDMENNSVAQETLRYATKKIYEEISRYIITSEDVYFSIAGTIGKVGIVPCNLSGALLTENAARLTPYYINKKFMVYLLSSPIVKNQHRKILSKVAQPKLSLIKLKRTIVPLPPLEEQKRIVLKINKLQEVISGLFK